MSFLRHARFLVLATALCLAGMGCAASKQPAGAPDPGANASAPVASEPVPATTAAEDVESAPSTKSSVPSADLTPIRQYLVANTEALKSNTEALVAASQRYYALAEAHAFDYAAVWADGKPEAIDALTSAQTAWRSASPGYEKVEGVVAGVPTLSQYDVILDAGTSAASGGENVVPFDLKLADGRTFEKPGNLFGVTESALWGTEPQFAAKGVRPDWDGSGTQDFGEATPDAALLKSAAEALDRYTGELLEQAKAWQPTEAEAFNALITMVPTMSEYFNSWKSSRFVMGAASTQRDFVAISRLADIGEILTGLQVVYASLSPRVAAARPAQDAQITAGLQGLKQFVADIYSREAAGHRFGAEDAERFGAEAQDRATEITGHISQVAAILGIGTAESKSPDSPAVWAEGIRDSLRRAQVALAIGRAGGPAVAERGGPVVPDPAERPEALLAEAVDRYAGSYAERIAHDAPEADQRIRAALSSLQGPGGPSDAVIIAAASAQVWTGLLEGAYRILENDLAAGRVAEPKDWLGLREFRRATRFARPGADATLTMERAIAGRATATEALVAVRADLLDTYQARLTQALHDLRTADEAGFLARRAELAALAEGYFRILAPSYAAARGQAGADHMAAVFSGLQSLGGGESDGTGGGEPGGAIGAVMADGAVSPGSAVDAGGAVDSGGSTVDAGSAVRGGAVGATDVGAKAVAASSDIDGALLEIESGLHGFRAAPLAPSEAARRGAQLFRYLALVPIEYGRGVSGGRVTRDLEIHEAMTFRDGAETAFADLASLLDARDGAGTSEIARRLADLETALENASRRREVAEPGAIETQVQELDALLRNVAPPEWQKHDSGADFDVVRETLIQMEVAAVAGDYDMAESARLEAYAILESGPEARIVAFAPQFKLSIESLFWFGQNSEAGLAGLLRDKAGLAEIRRARAALVTELGRAEQALVGTNAPAAVATNAGIIVFREGLEAVLILAALLAGLRQREQRRFRQPLCWGVALSFGATVITWIAAQRLLSVFARYGEKLEAVVSLVAIGVLLVITNWFFHKAYWVDWMAGFHDQKKRVIGGERSQFVGLVMLGFTSVYREGFETVLFLQALVLESRLAVVLAGVGVGLAAVALVGFAVFALQSKLPFKKMLIATGVMICAVLIVMVGNTVHVLQLVGWLPIHPIRSVVLPYWSGLWFGLYATWEGLILQSAAAAFVLGCYALAEALQHRRVREGVARAALQKASAS